MVWGLLSQPTRGLRTKGAIDALKKAGLKVDYIEINKQTNADPAAGVPTFTAYVSSHPDVKLVVTDHGGLTATAQTYPEGGAQGPERHRNRRVRPVARHDRRDQGRLDRPDPRPAGVAAGLPADSPDMPDEGLQVRRAGRGHRIGDHQQVQRRAADPARQEADQVTEAATRDSRRERRCTKNRAAALCETAAQSMQTATTNLLELEGISKSFDHVRAIAGRQPLGRGGRDRGPAWRQRRREVDSGQDRDGLPSAGPGARSIFTDAESTTGRSRGPAGSVSRPSTRSGR